MATMKGRYHDFEIVWAYGGPKGLHEEQITSKTKLTVTEAGILHITDTADGTTFTCAAHTWKFIFQHPSDKPGRAHFI
jgi:hypothetical protein